MVKAKIGVEIENQNVFVVSDIHGCYDELVSLLDTVPEDTLIIFLGDYIDRGAKSLEVLRLIMKLVEQGKALAIRGNHEDILLDFLKAPLQNIEYYVKVGGLHTLESLSEIDKDNFSYVDKEKATNTLVKETLANNGDVIEFLNKLPYYIDMGEYLFVHAGISSVVSDFKQSSLDDFIWIREEFNERKHKADKIVFFGHTPTKYLNAFIGRYKDIWLHNDKTKVGIDGGCAYLGQLNGVLLNVNDKSLNVFTKCNNKVDKEDAKLTSTFSLEK